MNVLLQLALSRFHMGLVIACGLAIGTLFTLFGARYVSAVSRDHSHEKRAATASEIRDAELAAEKLPA